MSDTSITDARKDQLRARAMHNLSLHSPIDENIAHRMDEIRVHGRTMAMAVIDNGIDSDELKRAMWALEDCVQLAIASLARWQHLEVDTAATSTLPQS